MSQLQSPGNQLIDGVVGRLEVRIDEPDTAAVAQPIAVICHPHPQHGGTMDNKVVYCLARELAALNIAVARFNFRGVGASEGQYDQGNGEADDMLAVIGEMKRQYPDRPLWLAGFSFGGYVAARAAAECSAQHLILVAPAVTRDYFEVEPSVESTALLIHGSEDQLIPPGAVQLWASRQPAPVSYEQVEGADHFFHGKLNELRQLVNQYSMRWLADDTDADNFSGC